MLEGPPAPTRSSAATSAPATVRTAPGISGERSRTPTRWSTSSARSGARGSASRSVTDPTTGRPWRPSPPRSSARAETTRALTARPGPSQDGRSRRKNTEARCDTDRTIGTAYGVNLDPQKGAQRVGVVIDGDGTIKEWHARVDARAWPAEVVRTL